MGLEWVLNTQNDVRKQDIILHFPKQWVYNGFRNTESSNFSLIMGFTASFDTQDSVKYWFLELNNVSTTKDLLWYFLIKLVLSGF